MKWRALLLNRFVLVPGIVLFLLEQRRFIEGLTSGATKG